MHRRPIRLTRRADSALEAPSHLSPGVRLRLNFLSLRPSAILTIVGPPSTASPIRYGARSARHCCLASPLGRDRDRGAETEAEDRGRVTECDGPATVIRPVSPQPSNSTWHQDQYISLAQSKCYENNGGHNCRRRLLIPGVHQPKGIWNRPTSSSENPARPIMPEDILYTVGQGDESQPVPVRPAIPSR